MSRFGVLTGVVFLLFMAIGKVLFPFGDEPDFDRRIDRLYNHSALSNFIISDVELQTSDGTCGLVADRNSLSVKVPIECMEKNILTFYNRASFTLLMIFPLLCIIIFRNAFYSLFGFYKSMSEDEWSRRLDAISLTLIFPSVIYLLGFFSREVLTSVVSLFIFIFWGRRLIVILLISLIYYIDQGNAIPVAVFYSIFLFYEFLSRRTYSFSRIILLSLLLVSFSYFLGESIIVYFVHNFDINKIEMLYQAAYLDGYSEKYSLILRPIITYISLVFMTAEGIKSIFVLVIVSFFLLYFMGHMFTKKGRAVLNNRGDIVLPIVAGITTICLFSFTLPTHVYAKYYVFFVPFVIYATLFFYRKEFLATLFTNLTVMTFLSVLFGYI